MGNSVATSKIVSLTVITALLLLAGCSSTKNTAKSTATTLTGLPTGPQTVLSGQGIVLTAIVDNDVNSAGVNWTLSGTGTLGNQTNSGPSVNTVNTITYTAPSPITTASTSTVTATSIAAPSLSIAFTLNLQATQTPVITSSASLPAGTVGTFYSTTVTGSGGVGALSFSVVSGSLPAGLTITTAGVISGVPTTPETSSFTLQVSDTSKPPLTSTQVATIVVHPVPPAITSPSTLPAGTAGSPYTYTLTATGGAAPLSYTLTSGALPSGLSLSGSGVISGTPIETGTFTFTVQVADSSSPALTGSETFSLQIHSALPVSITSAANASGEIDLYFSFPLTATGGIGPYTWTISQGSLPAGLSLNSNTGLISGTPAGPAATVAVSVTATDTTGATATQALNIVIHPERSATSNAELTGQYAFLLNGFDSSGNPVAVAGKFMADGNGNIVSGVLDTNGTALTAAETNVSLAASAYSVGTDNRGTLTLTTASRTMAFVLVVNQIGAGIAGGGYATEFDSTGGTLSGSLALQDPSAFTTTSVQGGYAFGLSGSNATAAVHAGMIGELQLNAGGLTNGEVIESTRSQAPIALTEAAYNVAANGRGTLSITLPNGGGSIGFAVYVVSAGRLLLLSTDASSASPLLFGQALAQTVASGSFGNNTLDGTAVESTERTLNVAGAPVADAEVGLYSFNGSGSASLVADVNSGGVPTPAIGQTPTAVASSYTVFQNGRATIIDATGIGGCTDCVTPERVAFLVGASQGFTIDFLAGNGTGYFQPQSQSTFTTASLSGSYALGSSQALEHSPVSAAELVANGAGSVAGTFDTNEYPLLIPDDTVTFSATVGSDGRTTLLGSDGSSHVLYLISAGSGLLLNLSTMYPVVETVKQ